MLFRSFLIFFLLQTATKSFAQTKFDTDSAFQVARTLAFNGKRAEARIILRKILELKPNYTDVQTLLGRTYSWDGKYDSAKTELRDAVSKSPKNEDATNALIDAELWSDNYPAALVEANKGLTEINPKSEDFLLKKARAQSNLKNYKDAFATLQELLKINPKNAKALSAAEAIKREIRINSIGVTYDYDAFTSTFSPWHGVSAYYSRKTKYLGAVIARVNYAKRFDVTGTQFEVDMYPKLTKKMYAYVNAGVSNDNIFPDYRWGFSIYRNLPKSFEAELGVRYLKYSEATVIYTGSVGKYVSNFWFSLRPYFIPGKNGNSESISLISRYYIKGADNHVTLSLGTGYDDEVTKDLRIFQAGKFTSTRVRVGYQHLFSNRYIFTTGLGYGKDQYRANLYRERYNFNVGLETFF